MSLSLTKNALIKRLAYIAFYFAAYMAWFIALERWKRPHYYIDCPLDAYIPFNEYFIVPYLLWFLFVPGVCLWLLVYAPEDFDRAAAFVATGMVLCLIIYTMFPNAQALRPRFFPRYNRFANLVAMTYRIDTSTNVCPSIHTFNTIAAQIAIYRCERLRRNWAIQCATLLFSASIIAATVSLKQHSVVDVLCAALLAGALYIVFYKLDALERLRRRARRFKDA